MVPDGVSQITGRIKFSLTDAVSQPIKAITNIPYIPIVRPQFSQRLQTMQCTPGPQGWDAIADGVVFESRPAVFSPDTVLHKALNMIRKIVDCHCLGTERMYILSLITVNQHKYMIRLSFYIIESIQSIYLERKLADCTYRSRT